MTLLQLLLLLLLLAMQPALFPLVWEALLQWAAAAAVAAHHRHHRHLELLASEAASGLASAALGASAWA